MDCSGNPDGCCDDGDSCTLDLCTPDGSQCLFIAFPCDDGNPCTLDTCTPLDGCMNIPLPDDDECEGGFPRVACPDCDSCCPDPPACDSCCPVCPDPSCAQVLEACTCTDPDLIAFGRDCLEQGGCDDFCSECCEDEP